MGSGAKADLIHVVLKEKGSKEIKDIPLVSEFQVLGELSRLPPLREIMFSIEQNQGGTILVHKVSYRMAPTKLKELKGQL